MKYFEINPFEFGLCYVCDKSVIYKFNSDKKKYFDNSYLSVVSSLIKDENISVEEIRKLLDEVESNSQQPTANS